MTDFETRFLEARKAYIASRFPNLNSMQLQAVLATEGPLLILAGAGSGKTTVLIHRVFNLLKYGRASDSDFLPAGADEAMLQEILDRGPMADEYAALYPVAPWHVLAITFTNKAAGELKNRLGAMLGEQAADVWACTFHSACVRMLRRDADRLGFTADFTIYDTSDSLSLIKHILKDFELDEKYYIPRAVLNEISHLKGESHWPDEVLAEARAGGDRHRIKVAEIYKEYMHRLTLSDSMDFDDLLLYTVTLLDEHEDVRLYWQNRFPYILIDEYQDTNPLQYRFSELLAGERKNICVVGDDDQSIYKFRGATIENILTFENHYPSCRTIRLEQNYRSTGHILEAANAVIRNNTSRKGKELWTQHEEGELIELTIADNEHDEAQIVASVMMANYGRGENWKDHAVLYRKNAQSNSLEYALKRHGIPYRIVGGTRFFDRAEVKDILSYMCVVSAPTDDLRLERIINVPARGIGNKSVQTALEIAHDQNVSLFEIVSHADQYEELTRSAPRMRLFANLIRDLKAFAEVNPPDALFDEIIEKTGYIRALEEKNTAEDTGRIENVREVKTSILTYIKESGDSTLSGFLANVALYTDLDNYDSEQDAVTLMTMHSSKGLEFPHVFLIGMEETMFPSMQAIGEPEEMEEERRLCYVAITRAMKTLHLLAARQRMIFGRTSSNRVSRFVDEIPEEHIKKNAPKSYGYRESSRFSAYSEPRPKSSHSFQTAASPTGSSIRPAAAKKDVSPVPVPTFALGDNVKHKAFGEGVIVKMTPMGNDSLIEISFQSVGNKKLMLRAAAQYMVKI